ncbi:hypothetical protein [Paenibacillus agricola]|uniref:Inhibitor of sigma-G Gin protein n=1 Tax=Paenibacillus agricola TaxID=2716264 RepID=A0ABX0J954_9BACL|nr:hypothetical protein [Paenibacillus agricola]NHN31930.1 hypothetical protein [Paenibacillus agricola]
MSLSNCQGCGVLHIQQKNVLCNDCLKQYIEETHIIKDFLYNHPHANVMDLVNETGFSLKKVKELVNW